MPERFSSCPKTSRGKALPALPCGGVIIIDELLVNDEKTGPLSATLMRLNMLIDTEGRHYTPAEYSKWLLEQGFQDIQTVWFETPGTNGLLPPEVRRG